MTSSARSFARILLVLTAAFLFAACGGGDDDGGSKDDGGTSGGGGSDGKSIFADTCGGCHTLADAGTSGAVGPNLDEAKPSADRVKEMIDNGGGAMPAGLLEGEERDAVADYVSGAAGK